MAQEQWKDLYFRHNFQDTGLYPTAGSLSASPDVIVAGSQPYGDPAQLIIDSNWTKDFGNAASASEPNYIYLRGQNLGDTKTEGRLYLYASKASLLLYPTNPVDPSQGWSQNPIKTSNEGEYVLVNPDANARFVTEEPFRWIPNPIFNDHYCLVGRVVTAANPNPIPTVGNLNDFGKYISEHPNMAWRNIVTKNPQNPTWTSPPIEYDQGSIGGEVYVFLKCINAPNGSRVKFSSGTTGPNPPFAIDWMTVENTPGTNQFIAPLSTVIPANWHSTVVYTWDSNGKTPLPDMKITLEALLPVGAGQVWDRSLEQYARPLEEIYGVTIPRERWTASDLWVGPTKAISLGSYGMYGAEPPQNAGVVPSSQSVSADPVTVSTSSIFVIGTSWRETSTSITGKTTSTNDFTLQRAVEKEVITETLSIRAQAPVDAASDVDLAVDVELNGSAEGGTTLFSLATKGVPVGATIWFKNTDGDVIIETPPTPVTKQDNFQIATLVELPPAYKASIGVYLQLNGKLIDPGYSMVFTALLQKVDDTGGPTPATLLGKVTIAG